MVIVIVILELDALHLGLRHLTHAPAPIPQQPGTVHEASRQGAFSSTASVTSTSDLSAAARCGSAIS